MSVTQATAFRCLCTECESDETEEPQTDKTVARKPAFGEHKDKQVAAPPKTVIGAVERLIFGA